jgi:hypothetical protein
LGIPSIVSSFNTQLPPWDFAAKIGFTALKHQEGQSIGAIEIDASANPNNK